MSTGKQPSSRTQRQRKRSAWPIALYWSTFILCAGASFAAGFWFTYRYTSQVGTRGLSTAVVAPPPGSLSSPIPLATPVPMATPQDLFAAQPSPTPIPLPTMPPRSTPMPITAARQTEAPMEATEEPTPEPTPEDVYRVQVGSYDSRDAAESMVQELLSAGIQAVVVFDQTKYHAQVGAFSSKERALAVADEVNAKGYSVTIRH